MRTGFHIRSAATFALFLSLSAVSASSADMNRGAAPTITGLSTDKARYAPGDVVKLTLDISAPASTRANAIVRLQDCGRTVITTRRSFSLEGGRINHEEVAFTPPAADYHGYRVDVQILDSRKNQIAHSATAVDVSSDWSHFPRYGYLAHFDDKVPAERWVSELNQFHINGLQFYDFQYKHHLPLAPPEAARTMWHDIANRPIVAKTLLAFLAAAKQRNMKTMAYNASYAAYDDAFRDGSGAKLEWAAWPDAQGPRTEANVKSFSLPSGWATPRLLYMNQDDPGWQKFIFAGMHDLLEAFPFDGWHIDTYGDSGAFAWDRSPISYVSGLAKFADAAHAALKRPVVLNTVGAHGQAAMANSAVEFVYSELWPEDHATYGSILTAADEIHAANPAKALVFAAYLHKDLSDKLEHDPSKHVDFNPPAVLLADAVIFSSGASHIELGDGYRMLSNPYFPADTSIVISGDLRERLCDYYDFLVAYENYLRDGATPAVFPVTLTGAAQTKTGEAGAVWTIAREKNSFAMVHLINFTGLKQTDWRGDALNYPVAPVLHNLHAQVRIPGDVASAGWASPDIDQGQWHELKLQKTPGAADTYEVTVPELQYWTVLIFRRTTTPH